LDFGDPGLYPPYVVDVVGSLVDVVGGSVVDVLDAVGGIVGGGVWRPEAQNTSCFTSAPTRTVAADGQFTSKPCSSGDVRPRGQVVGLRGAGVGAATRGILAADHVLEVHLIAVGGYTAKVTCENRSSPSLNPYQSI
jgi:hypothetical protein